MSPRTVVQSWVDAFNRGDADALAALYEPDAINHQVTRDPIVGREAIHAMFCAEFAAAEMTCIVGHIFEDADWTILGWRDPLGLRGCGLPDGQIRFQRGYCDKLSLLRMHGLPLPKA